MTLLEHALTSAGRAVSAAQPGRSALVLGNVGKFGHELLNVVLESPGYARVAVGVRKPLRVVLPHLTAVEVPPAAGDWDAVAALGWVPDDVYFCLEPERTSFWKGPRPYAALSAAEAASIARRLAPAGTRRAAVLTPLEALLQLGAVPAIRNAEEIELVNAGFARLLILRPTAEERAQGPAGFPARLGAGVVRVLAGYMTPKELQPVRLRRAAQVTVESLAALADGVHVIGAARLRELVGDPLGKRGF